MYQKPRASWETWGWDLHNKKCKSWNVKCKKDLTLKGSELLHWVCNFRKMRAGRSVPVS